MTKPYSHILVALLKGIVYSHNEKVWDELLKPENEADVKKYRPTSKMRSEAAKSWRKFTSI